MSNYIPCPRCKKSGQVFAYTKIGDGYSPSTGEYFSCPLCSGTGEADKNSADEYLAEQTEED